MDRLTILVWVVSVSGLVLLALRRRRRTRSRARFGCALAAVLLMLYLITGTFYMMVRRIDDASGGGQPPVMGPGDLGNILLWPVRVLDS